MVELTSKSLESFYLFSELKALNILTIFLFPVNILSLSGLFNCVVKSDL